MAQLHTSRIFLVGFMGTGKTTLGRVLADRIGWTFHDLDALMEAEEGASIVRIFAEKKEPYFRELERDMLAQLACRAENAVIATGGGAYCSQENQRLMEAQGITVWLDQPFDQIWQRRETLARGRPLMGTRAEVQQLYDQRIVWYRQAAVRLSIVEKGLPGAIGELLAQLHERFGIG